LPRIQRYGRFLDPILNRLAAANPSMADQIGQVRGKVWSAIYGAGCR
jgi:hypothetical protein